MNAGNPNPLESVEAVRKTTRIYLLVGLILFCGTGATVAIATVPWLDVGAHGFDHWDALLGLGIAVTKGLFVAMVFMHLNHERRLVYAIAALAGIHAAGFFIGTYWHFADTPVDSYFYRNTGSSDPGKDPTHRETHQTLSKIELQTKTHENEQP